MKPQRRNIDRPDLMAKLSIPQHEKSFSLLGNFPGYLSGPLDLCDRMMQEEPKLRNGDG